MPHLPRARLMAMAIAWVGLLTVTGGFVFSQSSDEAQVQAIAYDNAVRFRIPNDQVSLLRAEVFDLSGKRLYDSGPNMGNSLNWAMTSEWPMGPTSM